MRRLITVSAVCLAILAGICILISHLDHTQPVQADTPVNSTKPTHPPTRAELLALVNAERARNNASPLIEDPRLDTSAQMKADDEVKYHYFGHVSPNDGLHGYEYVYDTGIHCIFASENITENSYVNDADHAVHAWIVSPPHHAAMVDPRYTLTGFGISVTQIVEHFCQT